MDDETRAAFGRMDRYFELMQLQFGELRAEFGELRSEVRSNSEGLEALRSELRLFRNWTEASFARVRTEMKELRSWAEAQFADVRAQLADVRIEIQRLADRIDVI